MAHQWARTVHGDCDTRRRDGTQAIATTERAYAAA
jgi:hypothetical protein